jgi:hypothetical protein
MLACAAAGAGILQWSPAAVIAIAAVLVAAAWNFGERSSSSPSAGGGARAAGAEVRQAGAGQRQRVMNGRLARV